MEKIAACGGLGRSLHGAFMGIVLAFAAGTGQAQDVVWPDEVTEITFPSDGDQTEQPALYRGSRSSTPQPLVVFLHQWGGDYKYAGGRPIARGCIARDWSFIQPDFRGPNNRPEAMGSELVLADIRSAIRYAEQHAPVDPQRIFVVGASGGGYAALLAAARMPGQFRGVSAWVPISDLVVWHEQCSNTVNDKYAKNIEAACSGILFPDSDAEKEARHRSPLTHLKADNPAEFDINAGIHDGHDGASVPVSHSFHAYNALVPEKDKVKKEILEIVTNEQRVPEGHQFSGTDPSYRENRVLFRQESANARITIFEGGHEMVPLAVLTWLDKAAAKPDK
jgi:dienelactone hydrolase